MTISAVLLRSFVRSIVEGASKTICSNSDGETTYVTAVLPSGYALHLQCPSAAAASRIIYELQQLQLRGELTEPVVELILKAAELLRRNR